MSPGDKIQHSDVQLVVKYDANAVFHSPRDPTGYKLQMGKLQRDMLFWDKGMML